MEKWGKSIYPDQVKRWKAESLQGFQRSADQEKVLRQQARSDRQEIKKLQRRREPTTYQASGPCEVWCWDITYCPTRVRGQFYYLYLFEDLYSRKIVGYEVYEAESGGHAFVESLFRVLKYRPQWPSSGFASLDEAREWVDRFVRWYNTEHRHSKLNFVTPQQRHNRDDGKLLAQRKTLLEQAKQHNPSRWGTRSVRNCDPIGPVTLNPEKKTPAQQAA